jgi:hypothetical membrane protein
MMNFLVTVDGFIIFSMIGASASILGSLIAGFAYRGKEREPYSPLNHFISELGEVGVSRMAVAFNLGLIVSGVSLVFGSISLGLVLPGTLAKIGMVTGIICSIGLFFVGVFPMNKMKPHIIAAMTYFRGGLLMMIFFTLAIGFQPADGVVLPEAYSLAGVPAIFSFTGFLLMTRKAMKKSDENPLSTENVKRPKVWPMAVLEWAIFITIVLWFVVIALGLFF